MQKSDCSCCCDFPRSRKISVLGTEVNVKNYCCARDGGAYREKPERIKLQLSVLPTKKCNACCPFCIASPTDDPARLDPDRLRAALEALGREERVRGVTVTGGEPCLDMDFLDEIIHLVFGVLGPRVQVTLDTNGTMIRHLARLRDLYRIDKIHVSRHHWEDEVNDRIFGRPMPGAAELRQALAGIGCPDLFVFNCMLLKGYVATAEDARRYMDFAIETGAGKVSFITPSPVNAWTLDRVVRFEEVLRDEDPNLLFTRAYRDFDRCRCRDGVYVSPGGKLMEFYGRQTDQSWQGYCCGLVYGPDNRLRTGFGPDSPVLGADPG